MSTPWKPFMLLFLAVLGSFMVIGNYHEFFSSEPLGFKDFDVYYIAAKLAGGGHSPYSVHDSRKIVDEYISSGLFKQDRWYYSPYSSYIYPPSFAIYLKPLQRFFSLRAARFVWACFILFSLMAALILIVTSLTKDPQHRLMLAVFLCLAFTGLFHPIEVGINYGNANILLLLLFCAALAGETADKPAVTGISLALGIIIKITPLIFVPWLMYRKRYASLLWLGGTLLCLLCFEWTVFNTLPLWKEFITEVIPVISAGATTSLSTKGFFLRLFTADPQWLPGSADCIATTLFNRPDIANRAAMLVNLVFLGLASCGITAGGRRTENISREFAILTILTLILTPQTWSHGLVLMFIPLSVLLIDTAGNMPYLVYPLTLSSAFICLPYIYGWEFNICSKPLCRILTGSSAIIYYGTVTAAAALVFSAVKQSKTVITDKLPLFKKNPNTALLVLLLCFLCAVSGAAFTSIRFYRGNNLCFYASSCSFERSEIPLSSAVDLTNTVWNEKHSFISLAPDCASGSAIYAIDPAAFPCNALLVQPTLYMKAPGDKIQIAQSENGVSSTNLMTLHCSGMEQRLTPTFRVPGHSKSPYYIRLLLFSKQPGSNTIDPRIEKITLIAVKQHPAKLK